MAVSTQYPCNILIVITLSPMRIATNDFCILSRKQRTHTGYSSEKWTIRSVRFDDRAYIMFLFCCCWVIKVCTCSWISTWAITFKDTEGQFHHPADLSSIANLLARMGGSPHPCAVTLGLNRSLQPTSAIHTRWRMWQCNTQNRKAKKKWMPNERAISDELSHWL